MEKSSKNLHPLNKFNQDYDFSKLIKHVHVLKKHIQLTPDGRKTIDFKNPESVFLLNKALLESNYSVKGWEILEGSLCPSIPGRVNYIHYLADLIGKQDSKNTKILDVGTGASLIYPILGNKEYGWKFVGSETHKPSILQAKEIISKNSQLIKAIEIREQEDPKEILKGIIKPGEFYDAVMCNPPFYKSWDDYHTNLKKKNQKLHNESENSSSNFQGLPNELWYPGGEQKFITQLIYDSFKFKDQIRICSSLVSNKDTLKPLKAILEYHKINNIQITKMTQGNKITRILSWQLSQ